MEETVQTFVIPKNKKKARKAKEYLFVASFLVYPLFLFIVYYVCVNFNSILMAFREPVATSYNGGDFVGFQNFETFLGRFFGENASLGSAFWNSIKTYFINLIICMPLYLLFAYMIFKKCFMHKTIRTISMLPQIISGFVIGMLFKIFIYGNNAPLTKILHAMGVDVATQGVLYTPSLAYGVIIFYTIWLSFGTNLVVYPNAMKEVGDEIYESARLDGVTTAWQEMRYIILPLIFPTISTFLITGIANIFTNDLGLLSFFNVSATSADVIPDTLDNIGFYYTRMLLVGKQIDYPVLAAGGLLMTLVVAPLTLLVKFLLDKFGPSTEA